MDKILSLLCKIASDCIPVARARIAAAVVYKGEIVSIGVCKYKTHPIQRTFGRNKDSIFLHAEIDALIKASRRNVDMSKCILYIARVKRPCSNLFEWVSGLAKPCDGCAKAIEAYGIRKIIYTED